MEKNLVKQLTDKNSEKKNTEVVPTFNSNYLEHYYILIITNQSVIKSRSYICLNFAKQKKKINATDGFFHQNLCPKKLFIDDKKKIFFSFLQENHDEMINQACEAAAAIFFFQIKTKIATKYRP
jgi:hypothetical protein